ncbi:Lsr2 family DNA-binding protein [Nonomuraea sp. KM90]
MPQWAQADGHPVSAHGRIPATVVAYEQAQR